jgi:hypothetical protein
MFGDNDLNPVQNVLAKDAEAAALFDALAAKGITVVSGSFRLEDGSAFIAHWSAWREVGKRASRSCENEISGLVAIKFADVVERGLADSLTSVSERDAELVADVAIDVVSRSIRIAEIRELVYELPRSTPSEVELTV